MSGLPKAVADAWSSFVCNLRPQFAITLAPHRDFHLHRHMAANARFSPDSVREGIKRDVRGFHARLDRTLLGCSWSKIPPSRRTEGIWIAEQITGQAHAHGFLVLPERFADHFTEDSLERLATRIFCGMVPSATVKVRPITSASGWFSYAAKAVTDSDSFWLASGFHNPQ